MKKWQKIACIMLTTSLISCSDAQNTTAKFQLDLSTLTIATGGASGPYNLMANHLSQVYRQKYAIQAQTQTTHSSVENLNLLKEKKVEMAFVMSDCLTDALNGTGSFKGKIKNIQQIAALYPHFIHIITPQNAEIHTLHDLKNKRIAVSMQHTGTENNTRALLKGFDIREKDIKIDYVGYAEATDALKNGKVDAILITSSLPNSSITALQDDFDVHLVSIEPDKVKDIAQKYPYFIALNIPQGTYGNHAPVPTAAIMNTLLVRSDLSQNDVYHLTKTFFESVPQLTHAHYAATAINVQHAKKGLVTQLHPGAQQYYNEISKNK